MGGAPNQLRHAAATRLPRGIEAAQVVLGHTSASTTEIYAEPHHMKNKINDKPPAYDGVTLLDYYRFRRSLMGEARFHLHPELREFVDSLVQYSKNTGFKDIAPSVDLFRARILKPGQVHKKQVFPLSEMGAPPPGRATAGRINAAGIPNLYLAESPETAVAEVRPWVKACIAVARFRLRQEVHVVDFCHEPRRRPAEGVAPEILDSWVELIGRSFGWPLRPGDELSYIPTQYLSESFRLAGFDGIRYPSAMNEKGVNVVLFAPHSAEPESVEVLAVGGVTYNTGRADGFESV